MAEKKTDVFDKLDNVIGNYMDGKASVNDVVSAACNANKYLIEHPHPHDCGLRSHLHID